ncbi:SusD/RagB family nutrient-binding outer membrane lipoprotein [Pedobacter caeni]|uniref:Starch-binding associating with outer membrane n=1 Tax=Pedobacter caeni TaxID=288992 RepID=A0A1M5HHU5_9SPHI|nr:SusD/RagB family nutrient-binding outer membrane lipoprotein [Pedobacter caeni]SHG15530.1 Starch-binding associating with outer membrane [Pedobacter caeni]
MKTMHKVLCLWLLAVTTSSCLKYDELRENPNNPSSVAPSLLFSGVTPAPVSAFSDAYQNPQYHTFATADSSPLNYKYGGGTFYYGAKEAANSPLRNIEKMIGEAGKANTPVYVILAKFLKAYYYSTMTRQMGDIPLSEAMQGEKFPKPKYDPQKSVFIQCLKWLDESNSELSAYIAATPGASVDGDIYFNGDLKKWQKAINAYTLRMLILLSKKEGDADLNVKGRFQNIIQNPAKYPLFGSLSDNMQLVHRDEDGFRGTYNPNSGILREGVLYVDTYIDLLKKYLDPRLQIVADPTPNALAANPTNETAVRADFASYAGASAAVTAIANNLRKNNGELSKPNEKRFWNFVGQPSILLGYSEQELNIAEAAQRGWITENAKTHYDNGVTASMAFYNAPIGDYLTTKAPYIGGADGLKRIHEQMYLSLAENSGAEAWFQQRRTGVPEFKFSGVNSVTKLPVRWAYPSAENTENTESYRAALRAQFGTEIDDRDQIMWLLK